MFSPPVILPLQRATHFEIRPPSYTHPLVHWVLVAPEHTVGETV